VIPHIFIAVILLARKEHSTANNNEATLQTAHDYSMVSVATQLGYGMDGLGSIPGSVTSLLHSVQTDYGAHPASYPIGTGGSFLGGKEAGHEADHSPPSSVDKERWRYTSTPHTSSWHRT
jgi:hypothetical protein